ncbi:serine protease spb1 [bacterium]|nr:serine protease spb1 [bacterium]
MSAACCGGGFAIPSLITGDDKAQLTTSYSYSKIHTDVFSNGIWQRRNSTDASTVYKIEGAHIFADRYQAGFSLPIQTRNLDGAQGGSSTGLGDVSGQLGYEYLPDWNYSPWRPRGIGFISLTLPTGKSIYESTTGLDSRGRGFFALGIGTTLTKKWTSWDANANFEIHKSFDKVVSNSQNVGNIMPGFGNTISVGAGYNIGDLRLGTNLAWFNEDAIDVEGTISSKGSEQRYAAASATANYLFKDNWAGSISYTDQTVLGDPTNTTLSQSVQISIQKRWLR